MPFCYMGKSIPLEIIHFVSMIIDRNEDCVSFSPWIHSLRYHSLGQKGLPVRTELKVFRAASMVVFAGVISNGSLASRVPGLQGL